MSYNLIVTSLITGVYDVNRTTVLSDDDYSLVSEWADSVSALGLQGIIFHNSFSEHTCKSVESEHIHFVKVEYNPKYNPNVFRYFVYNEFLKKEGREIDNIFFTDASDVRVLKNPFLESLFLDNPKSLFCGDELEILDNEWMNHHSDHLRSKIPDYASFETNFKKETLLNCGIMGGTIAVIKPFIEKLWAIHEKYNSDNKTLFTGDMGAFNYLVRTQYNDRIIHGNPVNTEFKKFETNDSCWLKHK